jgi:hypothetical protein
MCASSRCNPRGRKSLSRCLRASERRVSGITPHTDKYCVCDPGPVTPNCQAPQLDHWCMGSWLDVDSGLNSENDSGKGHFARSEDAAD